MPYAIKYPPQRVCHIRKSNIHWTYHSIHNHNRSYLYVSYKFRTNHNTLKSLTNNFSKSRWPNRTHPSCHAEILSLTLKIIGSLEVTIALTISSTKTPWGKWLQSFITVHSRSAPKKNTVDSRWKLESFPGWGRWAGESRRDRRRWRKDKGVGVGVESQMNPLTGLQDRQPAGASSESLRSGAVCWLGRESICLHHTTSPLSTLLHKWWHPDQPTTH